MSVSSTDAKRRVKLYALNENRQWDDKGTGHVTSCYHEPLDGMSLLVRNESDGSLLLESKIQLDTLYQKQQGTLIVWTESDNYDLALSFQEQDGCNEIWEKICQVQGRDPSYEHDQDEDHDEGGITLVDCELDKLDEILEQINAFSQTTRKKDILATEYIENDYISKLLQIFKVADEKQDFPTLHKLYEIFKQLFLFDRSLMTELMLGDSFLIDIIGVFEYEPPPGEHHKHREFLRNGTKFKEVIPFSNQKLVDKIHQTYRVQYLQSSVLPSPSILEDNAYATLTNILFFNKVEIVSMIQEDGEFLQELFNQIISKDTGTERKRELVLFLREYCIFSQTIQPKQRDSFFKTLASLKILSAVEVALSSNDQVTKSAAIDIFTYVVEYNPNMTREHAVQQSEGLIDSSNNGAHILKLVIQHITTDQDPELGTATQLSCIIKLLLDPENMPGDSVSKHSFLEFFYFTCMQSVMEPINNATTPNVKVLKASANDRTTAQLLSIMLELLTFFMEHHYSQLRSYIISTDLLSRIITLMKSRHKFLVLSKYEAYGEVNVHLIK
jgi:protein phosphatase-4 regulatory subunit 3